MENDLWPVYHLTLTPPPDEEQWHLITAQLAALDGYRGIAEGTAANASLLATVPTAATLYFEQTSAAGLQRWESDIRAIIASAAPQTDLAVSIDGLVTQNWGEEWRKYFHTARIGTRIYVGPPWERELPADAPANAELILIEPGQAFGTGSHETTRLCLAITEQIVRPKDRLLDIGTGSGILLFAAIKCGAEYGLGVENDPVCEENFLLNAELNGLQANVAFAHTTTPESIAKVAHQHQINLVLCNMLSEQFLPVLGTAAAIAPRLVLSGFLTTERATVLKAVEKLGYRVLLENELNEWGGLYCEIDGG